MNEPRLSLDIAAEVLKRPLPWLLAHPEEEIAEEEAEAFASAVERIREGHPLQYATGNVRFWDMVFDVGPNVLIPRPETELLVQEILRLPLPMMARVLDVGTGSGAIAAALKKERPLWCVEAMDVSLEALKVAQGNFARLGLCIPVYVGRGLDGLRCCWNAVVSNPPYIATSDLEHLPPPVRKEPRMALDGGKDGLEMIYTLLRRVPDVLARDGFLGLEIGYGQGGKVLAYARRLEYNRVRLLNDWAGITRVFIGQW